MDMNFNLQKHHNYKELKNYLAHFLSTNFEDFENELVNCAKSIADNISVTNYNVCGFNYFDKRYYPNNINDLKKNIINKVKGDIFEIFVGFFVQYFETGTEFGIERGTFSFTGDLTSNINEADFGMDGYGTFTSTKGNAILQMKFRSNPNDKPFTKNVCASLFFDGMTKNKITYGTNDDKNERLIFFTNIPIGTRSSWNGKTKQFNDITENLNIPVIIIGKNEICSLVGSKKRNNTNEEFWKTFYSQFI